MSDKPPLSDDDREDLIAYLDGELDKRKSRALEARLNTDPNVRKEADSLRRTWELLDYLPRPDPSPNFTNRTIEKLTAQRAIMGAPTPRRTWRPWLFGVGWAAALLVASATGFAGVNYFQKRHQAVLDQQLVQELRVIENVRLYEHVDDIDFLHKLANPNDPDFFGDENTGS